MKILLTNHHLLDYAGTETYLITLAEFLKKNGQEVYIYSKYIDKVLPKIAELNIVATGNINELLDIKFDIAHVHHNINALEVRHHFPNLPIVFQSHGVLPFLEQPPILNLNISHYLAISEEVKDNLIKNGISNDKITILRNLIDSSKFLPITQINSTPKEALIFSSRITTEEEMIIKDACSLLNINTKFYGKRFETIKQEELPNVINQADIVFSLGRGAMEAMMCGRVPIIYDYLGGDGLITEENYDEVEKHNFSGRLNSSKYNTEALINEIKKYKKELGKSLRDITIKRYDAQHNTLKVITIYKKTIKTYKNINLSDTDKKTLIHLIETINITRDYTYEQISRNITSKQIEAIALRNKQLIDKINKTKQTIAVHENNLHQIRSSKYFKIWRIYCRVKDYIKYK